MAKAHHRSYRENIAASKRQRHIAAANQRLKHRVASKSVHPSGAIERKRRQPLSAAAARWRGASALRSDTTRAGVGISIKTRAYHIARISSAHRNIALRETLAHAYHASRQAAGGARQKSEQAAGASVVIIDSVYLVLFLSAF